MKKHGHEIHTVFSAGPGTNRGGRWGDCPSGPPQVTVRTAGDRIRIKPSSSDHMPTMIGHLALVGIPFEIERKHGCGTALITEPNRLDSVVQALCAQGAEVDVVIETGDHREAKALIEWLGSHVLRQWRQCTGAQGWTPFPPPEYFIGDPREKMMMEKLAKKGRA